MPNPLRGLLDRNILTALAVGLIVACVLVAFVAAVTGHYDSASVRAFIDDLKYLAAALGGGVAIARGLMAAAQRHADGQALLQNLPAAPADEERSRITTPPVNVP